MKRRFLPAAAMLACATPAAAAQIVALAPLAAHPTQSVAVSGSGFANGEAVDIYLDTTDTLLLVTSPTGTLAGALTLPASATPGVHYISAIGRRSGDAAQKALTVTTAWAQAGFGAAGQNANPYENTLNANNAATLGLLWSTPSNGTGGTVAVSSGRVFVGTRAGVQSLSAATGALLWTALPTALFEGAPTVPGNLVYAASTSAASVSALNFATGAVVWTTALGAASYSSPVYANGIVYVGCLDDKVYALNSSTGKLVWSYTTGGVIDGSASVVAGVVYIGALDGKVYALNAATGALLWTYDTMSDVETQPAIANGLVYVSSDDGNLYALRAVGGQDGGAGSLLWSASGAGLVAPAVANNMVFYGTNPLYAVNARSGSRVWSFVPDAPLNGRIIEANGVVYAVSASGLLYAINAATGAELAHAQVGSVFFGGPALSDGVLYATADGGATQAYALHAGSDATPRVAPAVSSLHPDKRLSVALRGK